MKSNCPSCGAEVVFKSSVSVFAVCGHCKSMLVRHDMDLENLGQMAQLPDDVSPLKIGTRGVYGGSRFVIIGRLKVAWSEGYWNEWHLLFEDGKPGWMGEALGFYMVSFEVNDIGKVPAVAKIAVGKQYELLPNHTYSVDDIKEAACVGSEGELPFEGQQGRKTTSVDLGTSDGKYACIEYSSTGGVRLFAGAYVKFADLQFANLRDLPTDLKKVRSAEAFKCPSCGGPVSLLTPGLTAAVVCGYCGSTIDATNKSLKVLCKANKKMSIKPLLPIGSKGNISGAEWETTGFMRRTDSTGAYFWDEYLLFNPYNGFRWLTTENGHWNFLEMIRIGPEPGEKGPTQQVNGKTYRLFLEGKAKVQYVLGEFYWRVKTGDTVAVEDYIAPPAILSCEREKTEAIWSLGAYIEAEDIRSAFRIEGELPAKTGVAPSQPSPYQEKAPRALRAFGILAACLTLVQFYFLAGSTGQTVFKEDFHYIKPEIATGAPAEPPHSFTSQSFEIPDGPVNLEVSLQSNVQNDWVDADIDLIDDNKHTGIEFDQGVEYYYGWDADGSWTEGSQQSDIVLSSIPAGRYHFVVQPDSSKGEKDIRLSVRTGVIVWSNYLAALVLLGLLPLYLWWRNRAFEQARWADSDLTPTGTAKDEEEEGE